MLIWPDQIRCAEERGGLFDPVESGGWKYLGEWMLGLGSLFGLANGDYGTDSVTAYDPFHDMTMSMGGVSIGAVNATRVFNGFFGLGIVSSSFGDDVQESPMMQAVSSYGWLPSYSYGYTAGAHYSRIHLSPVSAPLTAQKTHPRL